MFMKGNFVESGQGAKGGIKARRGRFGFLQMRKWGNFSEFQSFFEFH